MRILITLAAAAAIMAGLVIGLVVVGTMLTRGAQAVSGEGSAFTAGTLSKVAFAVLWCLIAGVATGLIGSG